MKVALTDSQKQELDRRLNAYYENPEAGTPWERVKEKWHLLFAKKMSDRKVYDLVNI